VTNAKLQIRTEIKDVHGRVYQVIDALNGTLTYSYDPFGNLIATADAAGHVVGMSYDLRGRKIGMYDPDMGLWSYAYNAFGELVSQTNARTQSTTMAYDALGRMISRVEPEGTSTWTYDVGTKAIGKLSSESGPNGYSKTYSYDSFGRPISTTTLTNIKSFTMSTAYNGNGQVDTITYPTGFAVKRVYNAQGYLSQIENAANAAEVFWKADAVDEQGHVLQETLGNGLVTTRQYNPLTSRLESIAAGPNGSIQNLGMDYDALGNLKSRTDGVMNWSEGFSYDELNRIKGVSGPAVKSYAYDAIGNITNKSDVGAYTYDPLHPHAVATAGGNSYSYDANGNMLSGAGRTLTWTSFDRPASISTANAYVSMGYDANHKRISKVNTVTGEVTLYIGGGFEEVSLAGITKAKHYIRSGKGLVAIMEQVATLKTMKYVHNDQLGSINVITDSTGAVLECLSFDAFGKPRNTDGTDTVNTIIAVHTTRGYTGHKMDAEVGLINMNARLYDPILGRFISADVTIDTPSDMQTFNRYHYVMNNPFRYTDPSGNGWWSKFKHDVVASRSFQKAVGAAIMVAGFAYGIYTEDWTTASYIVSAGGSYYSSGTIGVRADATLGSSPGGGTSITYNSTFGSGSYSSSSGWNYNWGSGRGGPSFSGNISFNGMQGGSNRSQFSLGGSPALDYLFGQKALDAATSAAFSMVGPSTNTIGVSINYTKGKYAHGGTAGLLFAVDRSGSMAAFETLGGGKFAGNGTSVTVDLELTNALTVGDLRGVSGQAMVGLSHKNIALEGGVMAGRGYIGEVYGAGRAGAGTPVTSGVFVVDAILLWSNK